MKGKDIVIFDIDGTITNLDHRLHHIKSDKKDWDSFNSEMINDLPKEDVISLLKTLFDSGLSIYLFTARFEKYRDETISWLGKNSIPYDLIKFRQDGDFRSDNEVKQDMLNSIDKKRVLLVVDDRDHVVDMWRENGLTCLQCQKGGY